MKLQLRIDGGSLSGRTFDLESGFLTIGRGENCSIRFDPMSERIASKQHAFIEAKVDGYYLTDNHRTNGVTASVRIDESPFAGGFGSKPENFRDFQVQQYNQLAAQAPANFQSSI